MISLMISSLLSAQVIPTEQDCPGALPICDSIYHEVNAYSGTGNIPNEITPAISCLGSGEKNDVWYFFTVQTWGVLNFSITPNVLSDDYDWAVYNLTNNTCAQIATNPALSVRCNYSGVPGITGPNGLPGLQNEPTLSVSPGEVYYVNVSQFSTSTNGYTINFGASTASIVDNIPPEVASLSTPLPCGRDSLVVTFTEKVQCSSVQASDFVINGPLGSVLNVTSAYSTTCNSITPYAKTFVLHFSPAIYLSGSYNLTVVDTILDVCDNVMLIPSNFAFGVTAMNVSQAKNHVTCNGGSNGSATVNVILGGVPPYTYTWSNGQTTQTATGLSAGTYTATITNSGSACPTIATITINQPAAIATIDSITPTACGSSSGAITLKSISGGTGPYTYLWSNGFTTQNINALATGTYTVTVTDASGCTNSSSYIVPLGNSITSSITLNQNVSCFGGSNGSATVQGLNASGVYTYLWSNGVTTALLNNVATGTYTATVTDISGACFSTSSVFISQPSQAMGGGTNSFTTTCGLNNGSTAVTINGGTPGYTYLWNTGNTTNTVISAASGNYTVTVTDANGCSITLSSTISASSVATLNTSTIDVKCFNGNDGIGSVNITTGGQPPFNYLWSNSSSTASAINLVAGTYTVTVTDFDNCTVTASILIQQPTALSTTALTDDTVCTANAITLSTIGNGGVLPYNYVWSNGQTNATLNIVPAGSSAYTVTVTDANNCTTSQHAYIFVRPPLLPTMSADTTICEGGSATMFAFVTGGDGNYLYNWNSGLGSSNAITVSPTSSFVLTLNVTDGCGSPPASISGNVNVVASITTNYSLVQNVSCFGGNDGAAIINVTAGGQTPFTYLWSNGVSTAANSNITATSYTVTVTDFIGCSTTSSITLSEPSLLVLNPLSNITSCSGNSDTLNASATGGTLPYTYLWSNGTTGSELILQLTTTSTYTVTVIDAEGCSATSSSTITALPPLSITSLTASDSICKGESKTISVSAAGGNGNYIYTWNTVTSTSSFTITPQTDTTLILVLSDGCTSPTLSRTITITVIEAPEVAFDYFPKNGCQPLEVMFIDSSKTVPGSSYLWGFGNGITSNSINPSTTYMNYGTYNIGLTITTPQGCSNSLIKQSITVYEKPIAAFNFSPDKPTLYSPVVYFTDNSSGSNSIWYWEFGDGSTSSNQNPNHSYQDTGTYLVVFAATNPEGCSDTATYQLYIADEYAFYIPNAFTPDGDGQNDFFIMSGINYKQVDVQIFNRYGGIVYQSSSLNHYWDGKDKNGTIVQEGAYAYQIIVTENQGKKHTYTGTVSIIR